MSIIRMLTRWTAISALKGRTWAGDRVFDSDNTPLAQALVLNAAAKPYIVVFTDADNRTGFDATDTYNTDRELSLVLEIGVASKVVGETGTETLKIPLTDEGMELALDMVEDQAMAALFSRPQSDWSELLKLYVIKINRISGVRGASAERDRRWAARQVAIVCDVMSDVPHGVKITPEHPIGRFIECVKAHPEAGMDHGKDICEALMSQDEAPQWEQVQATLGLRRVGLQAIGMAPLPADLPNIVSQYGDDLTDKRGEAPILRSLGTEDFDMETDELVGLIDERRISTNVVTSKATDKKDKVKIDGENP